MVSGISNKKLEFVNAQLNKKTVRIGSKDGMVLKLSNLDSEIHIGHNNKELVQFFNSGNTQSTKIGQKELVSLKKAIIDNAGEDLVLEKDEVLKIFGKDKTPQEKEVLYNQFQNLLQEQTTGVIQDNYVDESGNKVRENFNKDGSGTRLVETKNEKGEDISILLNYAKGRYLDKKVVTAEQSTITSVYTNNSKGQPLRIETAYQNKDGKIYQTDEEKYKYNEKGQTSEYNLISCNADGDVIHEKQASFKYYSNGNIAQSCDKDVVYENNEVSTTTVTKSTYREKDGQIEHSNLTQTKTEFVNGEKTQTTTNSEVDYKYNEEGKLSERSVVTKDSKGNEISSEHYKYANDGKTIIQATKTIQPAERKVEFQKQQKSQKVSVAQIPAPPTDVKIIQKPKTEQKFEDKNIENRLQANLPSVILVYEKDGKTVKQKIVNNFDNNGILIGQNIYDKNNKLINSVDFQKHDEKLQFISPQPAPDNNAVAAVESIALTQKGADILRANIDVLQNEQDEAIYVVTLPGARQINEVLTQEIAANQNLAQKNVVYDLAQNAEKTVQMQQEKQDRELETNQSNSFEKLSVPVSYTVSETQLQEIMLQAGVKYSAGSKEVILNEYAVEKFNTDIKKVQNFIKNETLSKALNDNMFILTAAQTQTYTAPSDIENPQVYINSDGVMQILNSETQSRILRKNDNLKISAQSVTDNKSQILSTLEQSKPETFYAVADFNMPQQIVDENLIPEGKYTLPIIQVTKENVILANNISSNGTVLNLQTSEKNITIQRQDFEKASTLIHMGKIIIDNTSFNSLDRLSSAINSDNRVNAGSSSNNSNNNNGNESGNNRGNNNENSSVRAAENNDIELFNKTNENS